MYTRYPVTESSIVVVFVRHKGFFMYRHYVLKEHPMLFNALGPAPTITPLEYLLGAQIMDDTCDDDVLIAWGICDDIGDEFGPVNLFWFDHLALQIGMGIYLERLKHPN